MSSSSQILGSVSLYNYLIKTWQVALSKDWNKTKLQKRDCQEAEADACVLVLGKEERCLLSQRAASEEVILDVL